MIRAATHSRWSCASGAGDPVGHSRARSVGGRLSARLVLAGLLAAVALVLASSPAAADGCPSIDDSPTGNCGPMFAVPSWTDAGGWNDPSQYATIQLADLNGDGKDELIGRSDAGIEIYRFDTTLGQWRPQVEANGVPQLLDDFASFLPANESDPHNPNQPQFYSTIQAADVDGQPGAEILARFWDGMRVYKYTPPAGGSSIDGGTWARIGTGGPFSDAAGYDDPSLYSTIRVVKLLANSAPLLVARLHGAAFEPSLAFYRWGNGRWSTSGTESETFPDAFWDGACGLPSCYLDIKTGNLAQGDPNGPPLESTDLMGRIVQGVTAYDRSLDVQNFWHLVPGTGSNHPTQRLGPFSDVAGGPDCPFTRSTADCLGASPSYYETLSAANVDGQPGDELLARASDGLRVKRWNGTGFQALATLTGPAGAASRVPAGSWGSIRTANIDGVGGDEVLFLDPTGKGLQAWSYGAGADAWSQLPASPALQLGSDPWLSHPEYYSTIQAGDVDGDGRDDVVARGPYGIRTWFYNRRGTGGWERYLAGGYPAFNSQGAQNEQNAYAALNKAATPGLIPSGALRDLWTGENAPQSGDVTKVTNRLPGIAGCDTATGSPPQVTACTPPAGSTGFTATQWTAVVNDMLAESDAAGEVLAFFADLKSMREDLFQQETAELPAIGGDLGLQAAAANTAQFNPQGYFAGALGIAASIVGLIPDIGPALSAAMWVGSEIASMIPQSSPTATASAFPSTYDGLQDKFATMVSESDKGLAVMSQEVRQDSSLLGLVSQLRESGPWATKNLDMIGLQSADNQGFAIWVYQTLMPTVYVRYSISNCSTQSIDGGTLKCAPPPEGSGTVGGGTPDFTALGTPLAENQFPCLELLQSPDWYCFFNAGVPPSTLANQIWGAVSATCAYVPGNALTQWTFGNCSAGVDVNSSVVANTWGFPTYSGSPIPPGAVPRQPTAASARSRSRSAIGLGRPRVGARPAARGRARVAADLFVPRRLRLAGAKVRLDRLLFERRGRGELTRPRGGRSAARLTLRRAGPGRFTATTTGRRRVHVTLRRTDRGRTRLTLAFGARAFRVPRACHALPAGVVPDTPPLQLTTRLVISDGRTRHRVLLRHELRCARDARGNVDRLVRVRHRSYPLRPGLAVSLHGPRRAQAGTSARYVAHLRNRRGGRDRLRSSLWDVTLTSGTRTARFHEVRRGRSRRLVFSRRVPRSARGRFCVDIVATAPGARAVRVSDCARVRAAAAPAFTG